MTKGYLVSKSTVQQAIKTTFGLKSFKRPLNPKLSEKQRKARLPSCKMVKDWAVDNFKKVIWSDESLFEVIHPPNPQNNLVWARNRAEVPQRTALRKPGNVIVWGTMSAQGLTELHVLSPKKTVNTTYYIREVLENLLPELSRPFSAVSVPSARSPHRKMVLTCRQSSCRTGRRDTGRKRR